MEQNQIRRMLMSFLTLVLTLAFATISARTVAACVNCKTSQNCLVCAPATNGGCECSTFSCADCIISQPCAHGRICSPGELSSSSVDISASGMKVDEATILKIGEVHPRFAIALAIMNRYGGAKSWSKITSFPAHVESSEVSNWLKPFEVTKGFFQEYAQRRVAGAKLISMEFTSNKIDETHSIIRGTIIEGFADDPPETQLEIRLEKSLVVSWHVY